MSKTKIKKSFFSVVLTLFLTSGLCLQGVSLPHYTYLTPQTASLKETSCIAPYLHAEPIARKQFSWQTVNDKLRMKILDMLAELAFVIIDIKKRSYKQLSLEEIVDQTEKAERSAKRLTDKGLAEETLRFKTILAQNTQQEREMLHLLEHMYYLTDSELQELLERAKTEYAKIRRAKPENSEKTKDLPFFQRANIYVAKKQETRSIRKKLRIIRKIAREPIPNIRLLILDSLITKQEKLIRRIEDSVLEASIPEIFAAVREASFRTTGKRHYDEQVLAAAAMNRGITVEMETGEGKTLAASMALYINALRGRGAHLHTPNDYLALQGIQDTAPIFHILGLSTGLLQNNSAKGPGAYIYDPTVPIPEDYEFRNLRTVNKRTAYRADITYGPHSEFGFDYLRDNENPQYANQRDLAFAIVDEVDDILIDDAKTPLILAQKTDEATTEEYQKGAELVEDLEEGADYTADRKEFFVLLTPAGKKKLAQKLGLKSYHDLSDQKRHRNETALEQKQRIAKNQTTSFHIETALKAKGLYRKDHDYIVEDGKVILIDEAGRRMEGRRLEGGFHQAIEAKEKVAIKEENITVATVTYQNFYSRYKRLTGMSGTAASEAKEFAQVYNMAMLKIPTHRPVKRQDLDDEIYMTNREKLNAIVREIKEANAKGQPVLVGTGSIEESETLSALLRKAGLEHNVLNAKNHKSEAAIIAQAGRPGAITVATNMAGRGVDIRLGGEAGALARKALLDSGYDIKNISGQDWNSAISLLTLRKHIVNKQIRKENIEDDYIEPLRTLTKRQWFKVMSSKWKQYQKQAKQQDVTTESIAAQELKQYKINGEEWSLAVSMVNNGYPVSELTKLLGARWFTDFLAPIWQHRRLDSRKVKAAGGLYVIGTTRHKSGRIDRQLRGRAGRQGDPGKSKFFLSLEDPLVTVYGDKGLRNGISAFVPDTAAIEKFLAKCPDKKLLNEAIEQPWVPEFIGQWNKLLEKTPTANEIAIEILKDKGFKTKDIGESEWVYLLTLLYEGRKLYTPSADWAKMLIRIWPECIAQTKEKEKENKELIKTHLLQNGFEPEDIRQKHWDMIVGLATEGIIPEQITRYYAMFNKPLSESLSTVVMNEIKKYFDRAQTSQEDKARDTRKNLLEYNTPVFLQQERYYKTRKIIASHNNFHETAMYYTRNFIRDAIAHNTIGREINYMALYTELIRTIPGLSIKEQNARIQNKWNEVRKEKKRFSTQKIQRKPSNHLSPYYWKKSEPTAKELEELLLAAAKELYEETFTENENADTRTRKFMLDLMSQHWQTFLFSIKSLNDLRMTSYLFASDPLVLYKMDAKRIYNEFEDTVIADFLQGIYRIPPEIVLIEQELQQAA